MTNALVFPARLLVAALAAAVLAVAWAPVAGAQGERSARAIRYDVELAVQQGGDVDVVETQEIAFQGGPFTRGFRRIPTARLEGIRDVRVAEPGGQAYRSGAEAPFTFRVTGPAGGGSGGDVLIEWWFPTTTSAVRTFVVAYRAAGVVRFYPGGDQVRWQAIGGDRGYSIDRSTVTLRLPADIPADAWQLAAYPASLFGRARTNVAAASVAWELGSVPPNQFAEVRAQWPHGIVAGEPPAWQAEADAADWRNENLRPVLNLAFGAAGLLIPLFGGLAILVTWYSRGRDPRIGAVPKVLEEPPSDLPPALAGTVVDEHADVQDVVATVIDLAERGVLGLAELRDPKLAGSQRDFELTLAQPSASGLQGYERLMLDSFFANGSPVRLSQLGGWFHRSIPTIQRELHRAVARAGLFAGDPDAARRRYVRIGTVLLVGGLAAAFVACAAGTAYAEAIPWPFFGIAAVGALLRWVAPKMPRRTAAGAVEAARWRAYARFLAEAPPEALRTTVGAPARLPTRRGAPPARAGALGADGAGVSSSLPRPGDGLPGDQAPNGVVEDAPGASPPPQERAEVFERVLPYAIALGIERTWVQKFATVGTPAPRWLRTPPVVVVGGPTWGGPWGGSPWGGPWVEPGRGPRRSEPGRRDSGPGSPAGGPGGPQDWSDGAAGGLERSSGSLADLLNAASEVLSRGGGSGWSGGGFGGGGGGGSGGGGSGFS